VGTCDGVDNDCNGVLDDDEAANCVLWNLANADAFLVGPTEDLAVDVGWYRFDVSAGADQDGITWLLLGSEMIGPGGTAFVLPGPDAVDGTIEVSEYTTRFYSDRPLDGVGEAVAVLSDVNGDGACDFAVGAPGSDDAGDLSGAVFLFYGPISTTHAIDSANAEWLGDGVNKRAGDDLGTLLPNEQNDPFLMIASSAYLIGEPVVYVVSDFSSGVASLSSAFAIITRGITSGYTTFHPIDAGDVNGDGWNDVVVGDPTKNNNAGGAYLMVGPLSGVVSLDDAYAELSGDIVMSSTGDAVSSAGDVDGDGKNDFLVGAPQWAGSVYLVVNPEPGDVSIQNATYTRFEPELTGDYPYYLGTAVSAAGDVDDDGRDDVLISGPGYMPENGGTTYLMTDIAAGVVNVAAATRRYVGEYNGDWAGDSILTTDLASDDKTDLLIGASLPNATTGSIPGFVYVINDWTVD